MKIQKLLLGLIILLCFQMGFAQQGINYKALIKDDLGNVLASQTIDVKFTIIADAGPTDVYTEIHPDVETDANGIIVLNIGEGNTSNVFADINWSSDTHSLKTEIDTEQDGTFEFMSTTQFMAVPYALNAANKIDELADGKADTNGSSMFLGTDAGANDDGTDNRNVGVGYQALTSNITGFGNVAIGYNAGALETGSNKLYIANTNTSTPLLYGDFSADKLTINGDLGLNTETMIGSADFTIRSQGDFFGGMYVDSPNGGGLGKPFYGYALNGVAKAYDYYDAVDDTWKFQMVGEPSEALKLTASGDLSIAGTLAINTDTQLNSNTDFTINASQEFGFGGMYIDSPDATSGKPFYGYAIDGLETAFHYYDALDSTWRLSVENNQIFEAEGDKVHINGDVFVGGKIAINTDAQLNSNTDFTIRASTDDFGGMYIDSPDSTAGKPFYGYSINGLIKAFSYFDVVDDSWKLNIEGTNILTITSEQLSISGSIQVANKIGAQPAGTIYYDGANFYGITNGGAIRQLDNTTNTQAQGATATQLNLEIQTLTEANTILTDKVSNLEARLEQLEILMSKQK